MLPRFERGTPGAPPKLVIPAPERHLTPDESFRFWCEVFDGAGDIDPAPYRVIVCWRLTRAIAAARLLLNHDQPLDSLEPEDWALLRPPEDEDGAVDFIGMIDRLGQRLHIDRDPKDLPNLATAGLSGLGHPLTIRQFWPAAQEIVEFEQSLLASLQSIAFRWSRAQIITWLGDQFGLGVHEAGPLVKAAMDGIKTAYHEDQEMARFLMIERLKDYVHRAQDAGEMGAELRGLKELAAVQGIRQSKESTAMDGLIQIMTSVAKTPPPALPDHGSRHLTVRIAEPTVPSDEGQG